MTEVSTFEQIHLADADQVGGKGLSLAIMIQAGLPVPSGFCVTTAAYRRLNSQGPQSDSALTNDISEAYRQLGGGPVAVRSSATAEDGAVTSFAGQQETFLGISGETDLLDAVGRCWASLDSQRAVAYRQHQGINDANLAMAVVVQRLVPAEVAGVLFTRDPMDAEGRRMLVEASWGLGESVVSGRVAPDRFQLDRETGQVVNRHISTKAVQYTGHGLQEVPAEKQTQPCLNDQQLAVLADLGRRVEAFYRGPRDVEWAWADGRFWLLQARPITAAGAAEREQVRREEIAALEARAAPEGTVWSQFNLSEILPAPTPMTWSILRHLLSGKGGFGLMYRDLGFAPDTALNEEGVYDLICGRPFCNLSREPLMYSGQLPMGHSFTSLKVDPGKASYPRAQPDFARASWRFWLFLPVYFFKSMGLVLRMQRLGKSAAQRLTEEVFPAFTAETEKAANEDLTRLTNDGLLERLEYWIERTLRQFARESLKPTVLAGHIMETVEQMLSKTLGRERARTAVGELVMGVHPTAEADLADAVRQLANGALERAVFLERFGHRGSQEMELAQPRWAEVPAALDGLAAARTRGEAMAPDSAAVWERIAGEAKLKPAVRKMLENEVRSLHTYLGLRETAKHNLMKGYALIRRCLVDLDRRFRLAGGIFYLTLEELRPLTSGQDLSTQIAARRRRRKLALTLEVPPVLFSDDLQAIGRPAQVDTSNSLQGVPLSAGVAEGPALVLTEPVHTGLPSEPYILICPSTDPAWVPLFVNARGLVMETGGVLSHGAIVAREFGLPAVAGLRSICQVVTSGQCIRVDGNTGNVTLME